MNKARTEFEACWFHPGFGNEVVIGKVTFDRFLLRFESETVSEEIRIECIVPRLDEEEGRIYLQDVTRTDLKLYTYDESILEDQRLPQGEEIKAKHESRSVRREMNRRWRLLAYFAAGCFVAYLIVSMAISMAVKSLVSRVPQEWEESFAKSLFEEAYSEASLSTDSNAVARLEELIKPLVASLPKGINPVTFQIVVDEDPNASALPGGHVMVNTGLLELAETPEELLGVMAHELAHVHKRHFARQLIASAGPAAILMTSLGSKDSLVMLLGAGSSVMMINGFSQEYETEADDAGWKYLVDANINPRGMISIFQKLKKSEDEQESMNLPQAFSTHPELIKRIKRLEAKAKRLKPIGFLEFTNGVPKIEPGEVVFPVPK